MKAGSVELDKAIPCPLLLESPDGGECTVYRGRPVICRVYHVYKTRDACRPYHERSDGLRPKICSIDHTEIMGFTMLLTSRVLDMVGFEDVARPWVRALPVQVANMLEATDGDESHFWHVVTTQGAMTEVEIEQIAERQKLEESNVRVFIDE